MYLNKVFIIGNLTRDPEIKSLPSGAKVTSFTLATNRVWRDRNNNLQKSSEFHNVVVFGKQAETTAQYLKKGDICLVEGRIQTRNWDDKETGQKKYRTEIIAERIQFGSRRQRDQELEKQTEELESISENDEIETIEYPDESANLEEIPF